MIDRFASLGRRAAVAALALTLPAATLSACGGDDEQVRVAAAAPPLAELARQIGGDRIRVTDLTPTGGQPHQLAPSAAVNSALRQAALVLYLSGGFQPEIQAAVGKLPAETAKLDLLSGQTLSYPAPLDGVTGLPAVKADEPDSHVWLDPIRYGELAGRIGEALAKADDGQAEEHRERAAKIKTDANRLDGELRTVLLECKGTVISTHPAFGYFAARYGLRAAWVGGISPSSTPRPATLRALKREAKSTGAEALVSTVPLPSRTQQLIERETGLKSVVADTLEAAPRSGNYAETQRANAKAIAEAANCGDRPTITTPELVTPEP